MSRAAGRGFTLIELIVAVAILGVLALAAAPLLENTARRHKEAELRSALRDIRNALDAYHQAGEAGRIARPADASGYPPRLEELVEGVANRQDPEQGKLYFLRRLPRDPFARDAGLPAARTWGKRSYASPPGAPQEGADVFDIYSLSDETGSNGVPYRAW